jgi:hypothetical protein
MLTAVVPSTSQAFGTARSWEGRSIESSLAFASHAALTGEVTANSRRCRGG